MSILRIIYTLTYYYLASESPNQGVVAYKTMPHTWNQMTVSAEDSILGNLNHEIIGLSLFEFMLLILLALFLAGLLFGVYYAIKDERKKTSKRGKGKTGRLDFEAWFRIIGSTWRYILKFAIHLLYVILLLWAFEVILRLLWRLNGLLP